MGRTGWSTGTAKITRWAKKTFTNTHYPVIRRTAEVLRAIRESLDALRGDTHASAHAQKYEMEYMSSER